MKELFGARTRFSTWRKLWTYLALAEKELGVKGITEEAIQQLESHQRITDEELAAAAMEEKRRR